MDTLEEIDDLLRLNPIHPEQYEAFYNEAVQVLIDAKYEIRRLQSRLNEVVNNENDN